MTTTPTTDVNATLQQIAELTATGLRHRAGRRAEPGRRRGAADRSPARARSRSSPTSTSSPSTSSPRSTPAAPPCASTPATSSKFDDQVGEIAGRQGRRHVDPDRRQRRLARQAPAREVRQGHAEALVESALWEARCSRSTTSTTSRSRSSTTTRSSWSRPTELLAEQCDWPLHLGVTEAGPAFQGTIKSAVAFGALLSEGIGDTIRVSLSAPPVEEVKVGLQILESLNLRQRGSRSSRAPRAAAPRSTSTRSPSRSPPGSRA
jgi:(E)-4-hydroxy-3-methylbut-2-enyl-diphosphate synthase